MTATTEELASIPHLVKAVILLILTTVVLMVWLAIPHQNVVGTQVSVERPSVDELQAQSADDRVSPFGPVRRVR